MFAREQGNAFKYRVSGIYTCMLEKKSIQEISHYQKSLCRPGRVF